MSVNPQFGSPMNTLKVLAAFTVALVFGPAPGPAQTVITSLPYTISTAGVYVLNQPLSYPSGTGNAITVKASNVTISLNGYGITNTSDQTKTSAVCIYAPRATADKIHSDCGVRAPSLYL
jgi:hypothetical protein